MDIRQTRVITHKIARQEEDEKHICPLQLEIYRRCILLFSNPGEIVFEPFVGIGSGGFMAMCGKSPKTGKKIEDPRRYYGFELKPSYFEAAERNINRAISSRDKATYRNLFDQEFIRA
jgi:DNA modification methylase